MPTTELTGFVLPRHVHDHVAGRTPLIVPFRAGAHAMSPDLPVLERSLQDGITLLEFRGPGRSLPALTGWEHAGPTAAVANDCLSYGARGLVLVSQARFPDGREAHVPVIAESAWTSLDDRWTREEPHEGFTQRIRKALEHHGLPHRVGPVVTARMPDVPEGLPAAAWDDHAAPFLHEAWRRGVPGAAILVNGGDPRHYRALWPALSDLLGEAS